jgi:regulator of chromosome condensation
MTRNTLSASLVPRPINFRTSRKSSRFSGVFTGGYCGFVVQEGGDVYAFGLNNYGQLGVGDLEVG